MALNRTAICIDNGLFQPLAHALTRYYKRVLYFRPWVGSFSHPNDFYLGTGYDSFERIEEVEPYLDDENVTWVFPDLHFPGLQKYLRGKGRQVWGAGDGETLELDRGETKDVMEEIGLPVKPWARVVGMTELRELLQKHEDVFVKVSKLRGLTETFCSPSYELVKPKLDAVQADLGGRAEVQEFIVESPVPDAIEEGYDGYCVGGQFPQTALFGIEVKDCCYAGRVKPYASLPKGILEVNRKLAPVMKKLDYNGFFATEIRVGKDKKPYLIDLTCRHSSPAGESILEVAENLGDIIEGGSKGKLVDMKPAGKFVCQTMLCSDFVKSHWLPIEIPKEVRQHVHLYHSCKVEGVEYVVPVDEDMPQLGSVTACAATPEEASKLCQKYVEQIKAFGLKDNSDKLEQAITDLMKA
jgi:phosphoribosylamine-glycine ligase